MSSLAATKADEVFVFDEDPSFLYAPGLPASVTSMDNVRRVQEGYEAFAEGDVKAVLAMLDDEVQWTEAEGGPYGGTYEGPQEVLENVFARIGEEWSAFRVEPERFVDGGDTVVATGTYSGTHATTGESFEAAFAHVWDLEDGQVTRFQQIVDTALHNRPLPEA